MFFFVYIFATELHNGCLTIFTLPVHFIVRKKNIVSVACGAASRLTSCRQRVCTENW